MALVSINRDPSHRELMWFGGLLPVFCAILGALLRWQWGLPNASMGVWIAGLVVPAIFFAVPPLRRPLYLGWVFAAFPIGWTISHLLLALMYYGVMTPIGLILRLSGYDPMHKTLEPDRASYWEPRRAETNPERYFRQF